MVIRICRRMARHGYDITASRKFRLMKAPYLLQSSLDPVADDAVADFFAHRYAEAALFKTVPKTDDNQILICSRPAVTVYLLEVCILPQSNHNLLWMIRNGSDIPVKHLNRS